MASRFRGRVADFVRLRATYEYTKSIHTLGDTPRDLNDARLRSLHATALRF
jgi:hypothetical protein